MLNIPEKIKICGITYGVKPVDCVDKLDHNVDGTVLYAEQEILIKKGMGSDYTGLVFLHEIMHGIFNVCSLEQDENTVSRLARVLYQVLKDNDLKFGGGATNISETEGQHAAYTVEQGRLLAYLKELGCGEATVVVKDGIPVTIKQERNDINLTDCGKP